MRSDSGVRTIIALASVALLVPVGQAQQPGAAAPDSGDLAKKLSNPISDLVSVPFQFNWEQDVGPEAEGDETWTIPINLQVSKL